MMTTKYNTNNGTLKWALLFGFLFFSCATDKKEVTDELAGDEEALNANVVTLSKHQFESSNMALGPISLQAFSQTIKTNGLIEVPPSSQADVSVYVGGYVKDIDLLVGQKVKKGQTLFTLEDPKYIEMQQEFLALKGQLKYVKAEYERQKMLVEENITSEKKYLKAESAYKTIWAKYQAMRKKLLLINIAPDTIDPLHFTSTRAILAPISGYITAIHITSGMYLKPTDVSLNIVDKTYLHIELNIFEKDLLKIKKGQPIRFWLQHEDTNIYQAQVYLVNKRIEQEKRTGNIHGHFVHKKEIASFIPGMYVEAEIITSVDKAPSLLQEAIVDVGDTHVVLLRKQTKQDEYVFVEKRVEIGRTENGYTEIINHEAFKGGDVFLVKGAFGLIAE